MRSFVIVFVLGLAFGGVPDNEGDEFIFAFGSNNPSGASLEVFIATRKNYIVNFTYGWGNTFQNGSVGPGEAFQYVVPSSYEMSSSSDEEFELKGQFILADDDIVAYASNKQKYSADAFLLLPTDVLGTEYYIPAWEYNSNKGGSMILVTGVRDNTQVSIFLNGIQLVNNFTLDRGEVYQYLGRSKSDDVTGARIIANQSVAVMSGNKRCYIKYADSSDHIVEMIPPINTLGREFLLANFLERDGGVFRIIGTKVNTTLQIMGTQSGNRTEVLNEAGDFYELITGDGEYVRLVTSAGMIVSQYSRTGKADGAKSDPMMALIAPVEQYGNTYTFTTPSGVSAPYRNYINVLIKSADIDGILLDGQNVTETLAGLGVSVGSSFSKDCWAEDTWSSVGSTGYSARTLAVLHGTHTLSHSDPSVTMSGVLYGQVEFESYGLPAGTRLASIGDYCVPSTSATSNDGLDNDCDGKIDEELYNGLDDDLDGLIDEDISSSEPLVIAPSVTSTTSTASTTSVASTTSTISKAPTTSLSANLAATTSTVSTTSTAPTTSTVSTTSTVPMTSTVPTTFVVPTTSAAASQTSFTTISTKSFTNTPVTVSTPLASATAPMTSDSVQSGTTSTTTAKHTTTASKFTTSTPSQHAPIISHPSPTSATLATTIVADSTGPSTDTNSLQPPSFEEIWSPEVLSTTTTVATFLGAAIIASCCFFIFIIWRRRKRNNEEEEMDGWKPEDSESESASPCSETTEVNESSFTSPKQFLSVGIGSSVDAPRSLTPIDNNSTHYEF